MTLEEYKKLPLHRKKLVQAGRRFGKSRLTFITLFTSLPIPDEDKQKILERYNNALNSGEC